MPRPFFETLRDLRSGMALEDLGEELSKALDAVKKTGLPAEMTLKLKIRPPKNGSMAYLTIEDAISTKLPKQAHGDTVFFPTADGGLSRQDPSQQDLPFRVIRPGEAVDAKTGEIKQEGG